MIKSLLQRLASMLLVLAVTTAAMFMLVELAPVDSAVIAAGENASPEEIEAMRRLRGLDQPLVLRYAKWISGVVQGDFGQAISGQPVIEAIGERLPRTLALVVIALAIALLIAVPLGLAVSLKPGAWLDQVSMVLTSISVALPGFWVGLILVRYLAIERSWFPATGYVPLEQSVSGWLRHLLLPALALAVVSAGELFRQLRASMLDVMKSAYIQAARAMGLSNGYIIGKAALKNAINPLVTTLALQFGVLLGGAVAIEHIFIIHGFGSLAVSAVQTADLPLLLGIVFVAVLVVSIANLAADLLYTYLNPKLGHD